MKNPLMKEEYLQRTTHREPDVRGDYFRDQTAIIHSMPFRRMKHKTQVFFSPSNDHVCTRIEHVMHVATVAVAITKGLNRCGWELDEDLSYSIGLGHDLGHAPFGHEGEKCLGEILGEKFYHEVHGYRVVEHLANDGRGLNLTYAVKDGIISHNGETDNNKIKPDSIRRDLEKVKDRSILPSSYEGCIVRIADKVSYLGRDIEDAIIAGFINGGDIPIDIQKELGKKNGEIINTLVLDIIESSRDSDSIQFSKSKDELVKKLKEFNYEHIYLNPKLNNYKQYTKGILHKLYEYLIGLINNYGNNYKRYDESDIPLCRAFGRYLEKMSSFYDKSGGTTKIIVADYIAGMTDSYALESVKQITIPTPIVFDFKK